MIDMLQAWVALLPQGSWVYPSSPCGGAVVWTVAPNPHGVELAAPAYY